MVNDDQMARYTMLLKGKGSIELFNCLQSLQLYWLQTCLQKF